MRYHGGKSSKGSSIAKILKEIINKNPMIIGYCEPFCGACGILSHVADGNGISMLAGDINESMILMWKDLQSGWTPDLSSITKEHFYKLQGNGESSSEKGFIGHVVSFGGIYFKYFSDSLVKYLPGSKKDVISRSEKMSAVTFSHGSYTQFDSLRGYVIFCDPPYENNSRYYNENNKRIKFDSKSFWEWCHNMSEHNIVIVNENSQKRTDCDIIHLKNRIIRYNNTTFDSAESLFVFSRGHYNKYS